MLWVVAVLISATAISGLASSKVRLAYYRHKDSAVERISEKVYLFSHRGAKREVRIVCLGDSMTADMPEQPLINRLLIRRPNWTTMLQSKLREAHPELRIFVYNYGANSKKISTALARMESPYEKEDPYHGSSVTLPPVSKIRPDIIILESHGYMDCDTDYTEYVETVKKILLLATEKYGAEVFYLVTICPDEKDYKRPYALYANDPQKRIREAQLIRKRLEDCIQLGRELGIPTIDVYHKTLNNPRKYIKEQDMVHPSYLGHQLIAEGVFEAVRKSRAFVTERMHSTMAGGFEMNGGVE